MLSGFFTNNIIMIQLNYLIFHDFTASLIKIKHKKKYYWIEPDKYDKILILNISKIFNIHRFIINF